MRSSEIIKMLRKDGWCVFNIRGCHHQFKHSEASRHRLGRAEMRYPVFIEKDEISDYGVTVPDLPGCFSAGRTLEDAFENAEEAILTHIEGLLMDSETIPSTSRIEDLKRKYKNKQLIWGIVAVDIGKLSKETKRINITIPEHILMDEAMKEPTINAMVHSAARHVPRQSSERFMDPAGGGSLKIKLP